MHTKVGDRMATPCTLRYFIRGIAKAELTSTQCDVCEEIQEVLSHAGPVSAKLAPEGMEVSISVTNIEPFTRENFEPYIYEQVLWHAVNACCDMADDRGFKFQLLSQEFWHGE